MEREKHKEELSLSIPLRIFFIEEDPSLPEHIKITDSNTKINRTSSILSQIFFTHIYSDERRDALTIVSSATAKSTFMAERLETRWGKHRKKERVTDDMLTIHDVDQLANMTGYCIHQSLFLYERERRHERRGVGRFFQRCKTEDRIYIVPRNTIARFAESTDVDVDKNYEIEMCPHCEIRYDDKSGTLFFFYDDVEHSLSRLTIQNLAEAFERDNKKITRTILSNNL